MGSSMMSVTGGMQRRRTQMLMQSDTAFPFVNSLQSLDKLSVNETSEQSAVVDYLDGHISAQALGDIIEDMDPDVLRQLFCKWQRVSANIVGYWKLRTSCLREATRRRPFWTP